MRTITAKSITDAVANMCREANYCLPQDILSAIKHGIEQETTDSSAENVLKQLVKNAVIAENEQMAMCQDTGMAIFFVEIGQNIYIDGGLTEAINKGVAKGYQEGYLRKSIVRHPLNRINTGDNTPAVIHYDIIPGDSLKITLAPKGFGSENMSALKMLKPSEGYNGVVDFVIDTVKKAGSNPCPPIVVGVGIGGSMELSAILSKKALTLPIDYKSEDEISKKLEAELLKKINGLDIGPMGLGGETTALGVNILVHPTHIAGLPVSVNISCHATRHSAIVL